MGRLEAPSADEWDVFGVSSISARVEWNDKDVSRAGCEAAPCRYDPLQLKMIA